MAGRFLMRTAQRDFALAYFENQAMRPRLRGFSPQANYRWRWFDPRTGEWSPEHELKADAQGVIQAPAFSAGGNQAGSDIAAKIIRSPALERDSDKRATGESAKFAPE